MKVEEHVSARAAVIDCAALGGGAFLLRVELEQQLARPLEGGHFFMLRCDDPRFPFLSRPFSVHDAHPDLRGPELHFLFKVVGAGTRCLAELRRGERVTLAGPLGRPFPAGEPGSASLLVAGGVGLPPLFLYLRRCRELARRERLRVLYGARTRDQLHALDSLEGLADEVLTATEDGSHGLAGRVDVLLSRVLEREAGAAPRVLTCGPDPMMARVAELAQAAGSPCWVSLETPMACGFGVCNACAVAVQHSAPPGYRYARSCLDGPVMDARALCWEMLGTGHG